MDLGLMKYHELVTSLTVVLMLALFGDVSGRSEGRCWSATRNDRHSIPFSYRRTPLRYEVVNVTVVGNQSEPCFVDLCGAVLQTDQSKSGREWTNDNAFNKLTSVVVHCGRPMFVRFRAENCSLSPPVLYDISIHHCKVTSDDIQKLSGVWKALGLTLSGTEVLPHRSRSRVTDRVSRDHLYSVDVSDTDLSGNRLNLLFSQNGGYENVIKLILRNTSLSKLPNGFQHRFPHLQYLDLSGNQFSSPPNFPWDPEAYSLPLNLSRTSDYNHLCQTRFRIDVPRDFSPRVLILDNNNITSLENFTFNGTLHVLSLASNGIRDIGVNALQKLTSLQHLNLSNNDLQDVPPFCSAGGCKLRLLDLRKNGLEHLRRNQFWGLGELLVLDIADNNLRRIEEGTFSKLGNLSVLHLERNQISFLHSASLPSSFVSLKEVYLSQNPLVNLSASVFLLSGIKMVDLTECNITFDSFLQTLDAIDAHNLIQFLNGKSVSRIEDYKKAREMLLKRRHDYTRIINLSENDIRTIPVPTGGADLSSLEREGKYRLLFVNFKFILSKNPISCDCKMADFLSYVQNHTNNTHDTFLGNEYFFKDWKCSSPVEFTQQPLLAHKPRDLYCPATMTTCPSRCRCYSYVGNRGHVVDCGNSRQLELPKSVPEMTLALRMQGNNMTQLSTRDYLKHLEILNLSSSNLSFISPEILGKMTQLRSLYLDKNALQTLPRVITELARLSEITLSKNPFHCDCLNLWMKSWLFANKHRILDFGDVVCLKSDRSVSVFVQVNDEEFVCVVEKDQSYFYTAMGITAIMVLGIAVSLISYVLRLELRALAYASFSIRLCDRPANPTEDEVIQILIVSSEKDSQFCEQHVLPVFSSADSTNSLVMAPRDSIAGLTHTSNAALMVKHSYRMIAVVSDNFLTDDFCRLALEQGLRKARCKKQFLVIAAADDSHRVDINSTFPRLKRFYKTRRYQCVGTSVRLRREKLEYLTRSDVVSTEYEMQAFRPWWQTGIQSIPGHSRCCSHDVYIAYDDREYSWVIHDLKAWLEQEGFSTMVADVDFTIGDTIQDNIAHCVTSCRYVLLILSPEFVASEWSLFVLRTAYEITLRENNNSLIVLLTEDLDPSEIQDEDLVMFLRTHAHLRKADPDWWTKLRRSLLKTHPPSASDDVEEETVLGENA